MIQIYKKMGEIININIDETVVSCIIIAIKNSHTLKFDENRLVPCAGTLKLGPCFMIVEVNWRTARYFSHGFLDLQHCYELLVGDRKAWLEPDDLCNPQQLIPY